MPDLDLTAMEARAAAATEGPWEQPHWDTATVLPRQWAEDCLPTAERGKFFAVSVTGTGRDERVAIAAFIAHARTDVPALVARVRELEAENAKIDDLDEALRQRDREILGLRRELARVEGDDDA